MKYDYFDPATYLRDAIRAKEEQHFLATLAVEQAETARDSLPKKTKAEKEAHAEAEEHVKNEKRVLASFEDELKALRDRAGKPV